ncbi:MAG: XTP/dITP diphosphatase [Lachnospiraceae bacterium]|nr:XTP/dITP diphosphatase [Lachnospiraceae bacterium]
MRIVFATGNANKVREIKAILADLNMEVLSMKEAGVYAEAEENGATFAENAVIKAKDIATKVSDVIVMADDSGLVVDALNGEPGIYSARYLGEDTSYSIKNANIIERLEGIPVEGRSARFVCAIAAVLPDGRVLSTEGTIEGYIGYEERGNGGFGYDPIFMVPEYGCSTAELSAEAKNAISHRGKALNAMKILLQDALEK